MKISQLFIIILIAFNSIQTNAQTLTINKDAGLYIINTVITNENGEERSARLILDSGSESSTISKKVAAELGIESKKLEKITDGYETYYVPFTKTSIGFGSFYHKKVKTAILDLSILNEGKCEPIDGILGYDIIQQYIWDFNGEGVQVYPSIKNIKKDLNQYAKVKLSGKRSPQVTAGFQNDYYSTMLIDWGDNGIIGINQQSLKHIDIEKKVKVLGTGIKSVMSEGNQFGMAKVKNDFQIANLTLIEHPTIIVDTDEIGATDALGTGIFHYADVIFDFQNKQAYFKAKSREPLHIFFELGFSVERKKGNYQVAKVVENSKAYKAGLRPKQQIVNFNFKDGIKSDQLCSDELSQQLLNDYLKVGKLELEVEQDGKRINIKIN